VESDDEEDGNPMTKKEIQITSEFRKYMVGNKFLQLKNNLTPKDWCPWRKFLIEMMCM
jgi:hypothetical protein